MYAIIFVLSFFLGKFTIPLFQNFMIKSNHLKKNYEGKFIPYSMGIVLILDFLLINILLLKIIDNDEITILLLILIACVTMAFAGLIDDFLGNRNIKGIKGHAKMLITKEITTGGIKAVTGIIVAFIVSMIISNNITDLILNIFIIALFTNFTNLMDMRPGRALKMYMVLAGMFSIFLTGAITLIIIATLGISISYLPYDIRGVSMLGDTGANFLGIILGIASTYFISTVKVIILLLLIIVHIYAEKKSISQLIDNNRFLHFLDDIGKKYFRNIVG